MQNLYDVIVVGAGPAGSALAFELACAGINSLVIEKAALPRYKCCGGGLTYKTFKLLQELNLTAVNDVIENTIYEASLVFGNERHDLNSGNEVLMYTVSRDRFDYVIATQAEKAGAHLLAASEVLAIKECNDSIEVYTNNNVYKSRFLVGADGAGSMVSRYMGFKHGNHIAAIESEVIVSPSDMDSWKSRVTLELGRIPAGYAWVFPKNGHLSIGIGCMKHHAKHLKQHYYAFLNSLNLSSFSVDKQKGGIIPVSYGQSSVVQDRILLVGDAAGLADPLTGEGIYNALLSAHLAAGAVKHAIFEHKGDICHYADAIKKQIMPELKTAGTFLKVLTLVPQKLFGMLQDDERVWKGCRYLLRGDLKYTDIMIRLKDLGGMYNFLFRR